ASVRARQGRGWQAHAGAGGQTEDPRGRSQEGGGQGQAAGGQERGWSEGEEIAPPSRPRAMAAAIMSADEGKPRRRLSDEERKLWGHITRSVAPLQRPPAPPDLPPAPAGKT